MRRMLHQGLGDSSRLEAKRISELLELRARQLLELRVLQLLELRGFLQLPSWTS